MACKLRCPTCEKVLKEKGDEGKRAEGEYVVIDESEKNRTVKCLVCGHQGPPMEFEWD